MSGDGQPGFRYRDGVLVRGVDGELVLLNLRTEQYYALDRVGADIVDRLTRQPVSGVLDSMQADYAVDAATLEADVDALIDALLTEGLIERTDVQ